MSAPDAALLDAVEAVYLADTGSGGLNDSSGISGAAYVHEWYRDGETAVKVDGPPYVVASCRALPNPNFDGGAIANCSLRLTVVVARETDHERADAVVNRIRDRLETQAISPSGWDVSGLVVSAIGLAGVADDRLHRAVDVSVLLCES